MFNKLFGRLLKNTYAETIEENTTEYSKEKEEKDMAKTTVAKEAKATENKANKEEKTMKATEKKATSAKENVKAVSTAKKATTKTTTKAKENAMTKETETMVTVTINGIQITCTAEQAKAIVMACANNGNVATEPAKKASSKKTASKATDESKKEIEKAKETDSKAKTTTKKATKGTAKKTATAVKKTETKPTNKAEAIEAWKSSKYSEEERKAYGEAAKAVREEMMVENANMVKTVKGKKMYDENYYVGAKWTKEFNKRMKARGFGK